MLTSSDSEVITKPFFLYINISLGTRSKVCGVYNPPSFVQAITTAQKSPGLLQRGCHVESRVNMLKRAAQQKEFWHKLSEYRLKTHVQRQQGEKQSFLTCASAKASFSVDTAC